jgi:hypothetical protein
MQPPRWRSACPLEGVNIWVALFLVQVFVTVFAIFREKQSKAFEGERLEYRS